MEEAKIKTLEDISQFSLVFSDTPMALQGGKEDVYKWTEVSLFSILCYNFYHALSVEKYRGFSLKNSFAIKLSLIGVCY